MKVTFQIPNTVDFSELLKCVLDNQPRDWFKEIAQEYLVTCQNTGQKFARDVWIEIDELPEPGEVPSVKAYCDNPRECPLCDGFLWASGDPNNCHQGRDYV